ncbi:hypothetical protein JCM3774_006391 [Rhodotorula dairenensis]
MASEYTDRERALVHAAELRAELHHAQYDPSHDFYHVDRVRRLARAIAATEGAVDVLVVELAALFHDLIDAKYLPASLAATPTARATLDPFWTQHDPPHSETTEAGPVLDEERRRLVERIVDNVSYSKEVKRIAAGQQTEWHLSCPELHCVQDADKLDAIGAFGIMRCAAYSAIANRPLFVPPATAVATVDSSTASPAPDPATDGKATGSTQRKKVGGGGDSCALDHFREKLFKLEGMMKTRRGRELATKRTETMRQFVADAEREWDEATGVVR